MFKKELLLGTDTGNFEKICNTSKNKKNKKVNNWSININKIKIKIKVITSKEKSKVLNWET